MLPIALGEATKLAGRMLDATKASDFTVASVGNRHLDGEGGVISVSEVRPTSAAIDAVMPHFTGEIEQVPPAYSALKIDGRPAYERSRAGETVEMKVRNVTVHELRLIETKPDYATFAATVSKGTYIRSLARDLAQALGTVGHVTMLSRTRAASSGWTRPFRWTF